MTRVYIVDAIRTPVGKAGGVFSHTRSDDLFAHLIGSLRGRNGALDFDRIDDVIVGCALGEAEQHFNVARIAALLGGLDESVPAYTVNRLCSSGLQSIGVAADRIAAGNAHFILAGGLESMSMIPMLGNKLGVNPRLFEDADVAIAYGMGTTAEQVAERYKVSRGDQEEYALASHRRACAARGQGKFAEEIIPVEVVRRRAGKTETFTVRDDEGPRPDTSPEALARLRTLFAAGGTVTAGNASQMSDGAGAVLVASEEFVKKHKLEPMARFVTCVAAGVSPAVMGIGPVRAIPLALKRAGLRLEDLGWIELNEAFAAQTLAVIRELGLDRDKVNPLGGAIALGHPLGATGALRTATLLAGMRREKIRYGMVTMCVGTGMGVAGIFENLRL